MAAFHGDAMLQDLVRKIAERAKAAVETGTFHGDSTLFMAELFERVWTIEVRDDFWKSACERFAKNLGGKISSILGRSQDHLIRMIEEAQAFANPVFLFLDAHWQDDWPLAEELAIVSSMRMPSGPSFILIVDDFQVPGRDDLYGTAGGGGTPGHAIYGPKSHVDYTPCDWDTFGGRLEGFPWYYFPSYPGPQPGYLVASDLDLALGDGFSRFVPP